MQEKLKIQEILNTIMLLSLPLCEHDDKLVAANNIAINKLARELSLHIERKKENCDT